MNIGIIGRARSGKDTAGKWLVDERGYRRVAFADALKEAALKVDPVIEVTAYGEIEERLSDVLQMPPVVDWRRPFSNVDRRSPWERAKDEYPEVRRILQELGSAMRAVDPDIWIRPVLAKAIEANDAGVPVVVTDGFYLVHINRPDVPQLDHESERDLGPEDARYLVQNDGSLYDLYARMEVVWTEIHHLESIKHGARL
jgi:hypothetical protein